MNRKECMSKPGMPWPLTGCNCLPAAIGNPQTPEQEGTARRFGSLPGNPSPCGWHRRPRQTCFVYPAANSAWHRVGTWAMCGKQREPVRGVRRVRDACPLGPAEATWMESSRCALHICTTHVHSHALWEEAGLPKLAPRLTIIYSIPNSPA